MLRLLQDLSNKTGLLPKDYWLSEIEEGERIGSGGEASIFKGVLLKNSKQEVIVLRKVHHTTLVKVSQFAIHYLTRCPDGICVAP